MGRRKALLAAAILIFSLSWARGWTQAIHTPYDPDLLAETLRENNRGFDFDRREAMIPMRSEIGLYLNRTV